MRISLRKKIGFFIEYRANINRIRKELLTQLGLRVDGAYRLYTVLNIPEELYGEFVIKKSDIDTISDTYIREYYAEASKLLNSNNLSELYNVYSIKKITKYSFLIVIGFSLFKSHKFYNLIYYVLLPILVIGTIYLVNLYS